jgi:hypothetical protein
MPNGLEPLTNDTIASSSLEGVSKHLTDNAIKYLNRFIEVYQVYVDTFWMRPLTVEDIHEFVIGEIRGKEITDKYMIGKTGGPIHSGNLSESEEKELRTRLIKGSNITLERKLELQAMNEFDLGNLDISAININRMFEIWIRKKLVEVKQARGSSEQEARGRIRHPSGQYMDLKNIVEIITKDLGFDFKNTDEYQKYFDNTRTLRNNVIHQEYTPNTTEVQKSGRSAIIAMRRFYREFSDEMGWEDVEETEDSQNYEVGFDWFNSYSSLDS